MYHRVIARLDIKGPNLVKGIHLEGLRVLGKPEDFAAHYYEQGIDELLYIDVVASLYGRNSLHDIVSRTAQNMFVPLTVGGGLRSVDDIRSVLRAGADKVSINTAALKNPQLIRDAALEFGSSTITVSIEAIRHPSGEYFAYTDNGRDETGQDVFEWIQKVQELGAGEILLTSVDREGTGEGFDLELLSEASRVASIPIVASGGAGAQDHVVEMFQRTGAHAVAVASILHYEVARLLSGDHSRYEAEGNTEFLKAPKKSSRLQETTVPELKESLRAHGVSCRI